MEGAWDEAMIAMSRWSRLQSLWLLVLIVWGCQPTKPIPAPAGSGEGSAAPAPVVAIPALPPRQERGGIGRTGAVEWQAPAALQTIVWKVQLESASTTIAFGTRLFAANAKSLAAIDGATGQTIWSRPVTRGMASTPVITEEAVLLSTGDRKLASLDTKTGETRWETRLKQTADGGLLLQGDRLFVTSSAGTAWSFDASNGKKDWSVWIAPSVQSAPALDGDLLLIGAGLKRGGAVFAMKTDSGAEWWSMETDASVTVSPAVIG